MTAPLLQVHDIARRFGPIEALGGVTFRVDAGEIVGLIGPNGAGKTTLLECIAGLIPRDRGDIHTAGLFYLPDDLHPWEEQPVGWVLRFWTGLQRIDQHRMEALIEELALRPLLPQPVHTLSRGQRKRLLLALAFLAPADLLLLDEPFESLDIRQVQETMAFLRRQVAKGRTLLLSIHQLTDAARICDRMLLLDHGRLVGEGSLDALRTQAHLPDGSLEDVFLALT